MEYTEKIQLMTKAENSSELNDLTGDALDVKEARQIDEEFKSIRDKKVVVTVQPNGAILNDEEQIFPAYCLLLTGFFLYIPWFCGLIYWNSKNKAVRTASKLSCFFAIVVIIIIAIALLAYERGFITSSAL